MTPADALAMHRFLLLCGLRVTGVSNMIMGAVNLAKAQIEWQYLIGGVLIAAGFVTGLLVPQILARRWRSPPDS